MKKEPVQRVRTLLVCTQRIDEADPALGFFLVWVRQLAERFDHIHIICLEKGSYTLPRTVSVHSLGKEQGASRWMYITRFYQYLWRYRKEYLGVFVHMNPEYVILGGLWWRLTRKRILFWYTHKAINLRLRLAERLATKIFTASKESFRLSSTKVEVTGHGIALGVQAKRRISAGEYRLLVAGRISPVKDLETVLLGVRKLMDAQVPVRLTIIGGPVTPSDEEYARTIEELIQTLGLTRSVRIQGPLPYVRMADAYAEHDILVHTSRTGSLDKVVLEAMAAGLAVVSSSEAYANMSPNLIAGFAPHDPDALAGAVEKVIKSGMLEQSKQRQDFVKTSHDLDRLIDRITGYFGV